MGSRALLLRCVNRYSSGSQYYKCISSSSVMRDSKLSTKGTTKQNSGHVPNRKSNDVFFAPQEKIEHDKALRSLITIESEQNAVGIVSGVPEEHIKTRTVYIYKPAKNPMQSGRANTHHWQICFDTRERWENGLMGWCSSGDPLQATRVDFATKEEAIEHCKNMGWKYIVDKENPDNPKSRSYGANFSWDKRTRVSTK